MTDEQKANQLIVPNSFGTGGFQEDDIDDMLKICIEQIWEKFDDDKNNILSKDEAKKFITAAITELMGGNVEDDTMFDHVMPQQQFDQLFNSIDVDGGGEATKEEMFLFIKKCGKF